MQWFDLGLDCEILRENIFFALEKAGNDKPREDALAKLLQELEDLLFAIKSEEFEEGDFQNAQSVWSKIYEGYEDHTRGITSSGEDSGVESGDDDAGARN